MDEVKSLIHTLNRCRVLITGPLYGADKFESYVEAIIVVVPSRYEIFGNVVLESYSCYKPVIASEVPGLQEIVFNEQTGLLVKPDDVNALYLSLLRLLTDEQTTIRMGMAARRLVERNFRIEKIVNEIETTYFEILKSIKGRIIP